MTDLRAVARRGDPWTSWAAARSQTPDHIRASQRYIIELFLLHGRMTDTALISVASPRLSPSGARTRRAELVELGLICDTGERVILPSRRKAIVWALSQVEHGPMTLW